MQRIDEQDRVLFITADRGTLYGDALAPSPVDELKADGLCLSRLKLVTRLGKALAAVEEWRTLLTCLEGVAVAVDSLTDETRSEVRRARSRQPRTQRSPVGRVQRSVSKTNRTCSTS